MYATNFDPATKIWSGPKNELQIEKTKGFGEIILEKLAAAKPDAVAQIDGDTGVSMTVGEIRTQTIRCAQNLQKLGCAQNDHITIIARNSHNLTPLVLASICIGAPISPLDVVIVKDGISLFIDRIKPKFIFCDTDIVEVAEKLVKNAGIESKIFTVNGTLDGYTHLDDLLNETGNENEFVCTPVSDTFKQTAVIACSSGSTGLPKSVLMSHALLIHVFLSGIYRFSFVTLCFSSLYWFSGIWACINPAVSSNVRVFTSKSFSTKLFFDLVTKYKVQFFAGPPCQLQDVIKSEEIETTDLSTLAMCISVGAHIPLVLIQMMKKYIPQCFLLTAFGMTEVGGGVTLTLPTEIETNPKTAGRLMRGVDIKILKEDSGEKCGIGEEGEIYVKNPVMFTGYFQNEEATKSAFDEEGYFITGDLGYFDEDGYIYIIGRKKEIFKNCGFAIWPAEIENILLKHPAIHNASVVSVYNEEKITELPAAVVVKKQGHSITKDEIYQLVADQLAEYKRLDGGIFFVDSLPMTPSDKIMRNKVKEIAQNLYEKA